MRALVLLLALLACAPTLARADDDTAPHRERLAACIAAAETADALAACRGVAVQPCMDADGGTTLGMMLCLGAEAEVWDAEVLASLARLRAARPDAVAALELTQSAWDTYVESACAYRVILWGDGSGARVELAACYAALNAERAIALRRAEAVAS